MTDSKSQAKQAKLEDFDSIGKDDAKNPTSPISPALDANSPNPLQTNHQPRQSDVYGIG